MAEATLQTLLAIYLQPKRGSELAGFTKAGNPKFATQ